jgi:RNA 3'-terminal phosphate cyclase (ATP)
MNFIEIDGSSGEGGGQILRTSLSLSVITGAPFEITNIRAGRKNPGLRHQHLASVNAAARICSASLEGARLGSACLKFIPKEVLSGEYDFDIGTAGSTALVLQTIFYPLALRGNSVSLVNITGGTHVPWSPPFEFLKEGWLPFMKRIGFRADLELKRAGFYPRGGGEIVSRIEPVATISSLEVRERGELLKVYGISAVGGLSMGVAERGRKRLSKVLDENGIPNEVGVAELPSYGRGAIVFLKAVFKNSTVSFSSIGEIGKRMETVAEEACKKLIDFLKSDATVDENMADQLILPLALSPGRSYFKIPKTTEHMRTNAAVVSRFLENVRIHIEGGEVLIEGSYPK